jgi:hypothetical protein
MFKGCEHLSALAFNNNSSNFIPDSHGDRSAYRGFKVHEIVE